MAEPRQVFSLDAVRSDGWVEQMGDGSREFKQLCELIGERFVAFGVLAGVRITALTVDRRNADSSLVDFVVGDEPGEQRLPLGEFRRRLGSAMLADEEVLEDLPELATPDALQAYIGQRTVLLAPLFGIRLRELRVGGPASPSVVVDLGGASDEITLSELRDVIRERVRGEVSRSRAQSPFAIDLGRVPEAEEASGRGDTDRVVELLGAWPGPLSLLLRTTEGQQLAPESKASLARALGLLGSAYVKKERFDWAEEILRLGIQWGQEGLVAADLFRRLGESHVARERHGEAIGLLRRSLALGAPKRLVLPSLARCYSARSKHVAAMACVDEALAAGAPVSEIAETRDTSLAVLGEAWTRFRELVPRTADSRAPTLPPGRRG